MSSLRRPPKGVAGLAAALCIWTSSCGRSAAAPTDGAKVWGYHELSDDRRPSLPSDGALTDREYHAGLRWRFRAGSPLAGAPVTSPEGDLYLGTTQGYVFSIDSGGRFRWAYTVIGAAVGQPVADDSGRVFVATTARRIYALEPGGRESWLFRSPARIGSGLARGRDGELYFAGMDEHLWALSSRAKALFRVDLGAMATAGPTVDASGEWVGVGTADGRLLLVHGSREKREYRAGTSAIVSAPILLSEQRVAIVSGGALRLFDRASAEVAWSRKGVEQAARAGGALLAVTASGDLEWIGADGTVKRRVPLGEAASAPPVVGRNGTVYVPSHAGRLIVVGESDRVHRIPVAHASLFTPLVTSEQVIASAGDGTVVGVRLDAGGS